MNNKSETTTFFKSGHNYNNTKPKLAKFKFVPSIPFN